MIDIDLNGVTYEVPSSAADTNWAAKQVAFEQAVAADITTNADDIAALETAATPAAVVGTAGSGTGISGASTSYGRNVVHKITVGFTALQNASTSKDVTLWVLPAKSRVLRVISDVTAAFTGGSISAVAMVCGRAAGGDQYLLTHSVLSGTGARGTQQTELGAGVVGGTGFSSDIIWTTTTTVQARFTSTSADLSDLTTGSTTFYIECCTYP